MLTFIGTLERRSHERVPSRTLIGLLILLYKRQGKADNRGLVGRFNK